MATYPNFYENIQEALMRLKRTIVLYDKLPYYIWTIAHGHADGKFRVFMSRIEDVHKVKGSIPAGNTIPDGHTAMLNAMNTWLEGMKEQGIESYVIRKHIDSPLFNKFRPFPMGMLNQNTMAIYVARQPVRPKTEQGLVPSMLFNTRITAAQGVEKNVHVDIYTEAFRDCILGRHPSPKEVLKGIQDPKYQNESVAFHREFALVRGPIDLIFLAYREDIVGVLPNGDFSKIRLGRQFKHTKEVVEELNLFYNID